MATRSQSGEQPFPIDDFSGGQQNTTTFAQKRGNELARAENVDYGVIGGIGKVPGYTQRAGDLTSTTSTSTSTSTTTTSTSTSSSTSTSTSTTTTA